MAEISIDILNSGIGHLTTAQCAVMAEACVCCLHNNSHIDGVQVECSGIVTGNHTLRWSIVVTNQLQGTYADSGYATEMGAYGLAFLIMRDFRSYEVVHRSVKSTGFDYWVAKGTSFIQDSARLEVSGILNGDDKALNSRLAMKRKQISQSSGKLKAFVVVVEFGKPKIVVEEHD